MGEPRSGGPEIPRLPPELKSRDCRLVSSEELDMPGWVTF